MTTRGSAHYPIKLRELREDGGGRVMGYYAKGHHNRQAFAKFVEDVANEEAAHEAEFDEEPRYRIRVPVVSVRHVWWRCVPSQEGDGSYLFIGAKPRSRGAFRATVTEHYPLAGWEGTSDAIRGQSCWCPACGQPQRSNETSRRLYEWKHRNAAWRTARDWDGGVVLMTGDQMQTIYPCSYIRWEDFDKPFVVDMAKRHGFQLPTRPEVISHAA